MAHVEDRRSKTTPDGTKVPTNYPKPWRARLRGPDGKERSRSFPTKAQAQRWLTEQRHALDHGDWVDPARGRLRYREWAEQWQLLTIDKRESTKARDTSYLTNHILPTFGEVPIARIDHLSVQQWVAMLNTKGLAPATVRKAAHIFGASMRAAARSGVIAQSPCIDLSLPKVEHREQRFLTPGEVAVLADAIHPRYRAAVLLGAYGGLRAGELFGLRVGSIDPMKSTVRIKEIAVEVHGRLHYGPPKTRAGVRTVPLPRAVSEVLAEHVAGMAPDSVAFPAPQGGTTRLGLFRSRFWTPAVKAAGLDPLRVHDLRHTAVCFWLLTRKATAKDVATWAGHASVATILDLYGHLLPGHESEPMDALDAIFRQAEAEKPTDATVVDLGEQRRRAVGE